MEIGSLNHAISFLGMRGVSSRESIPPVSRRDSADQNRLGKQADNEPAFTTQFSAEALERADRLAASRETQAEPEIKTSLSKEDEGKVKDLKRRDQEVRQHEQAHKAAAGQLASGGPSFEFERGPDGKRYAVGGEVQIDVSSVAGDPEATIRKMRQVQSAARAPSSPSSTDLKVAAKAAQQETAARAELRETKNEDADPQQAATLPAAYRAAEASQRGGLLNVVA